MPFAPQIIQGTVGNWNLDELAQSGVLGKGAKFSLDADVKDTHAHVSATKLDQIVRTRTTVRALLIDMSAEAIPDQNGLLTGIAAAFAGQHLAVCAHFAADVTDGSGNVELAGRIVFGFKRDSAKYLQVMEPSIDLHPDNPADLSHKLRYLPEIDFDSDAAA